MAFSKAVLKASTIFLAVGAGGGIDAAAIGADGMPNDDVKVIETFDRPSSLVFPWQAQMFTSEWNKIVSKSCTLSNGGVSGSGNEPEDEGKVRLST